MALTGPPLKELSLLFPDEICCRLNPADGVPNLELPVTVLSCVSPACLDAPCVNIDFTLEDADVPAAGLGDSSLFYLTGSCCLTCMTFGGFGGIGRAIERVGSWF